MQRKWVYREQAAKWADNFTEQNKKLYIPLLFAFSCLDLSCGPPQCKGFWLPVPTLHPRGKMHPQKQGEMDETYPYEEKYINGPQDKNKKQWTVNKIHII